MSPSCQRLTAASGFSFSSWLANGSERGFGLAGVGVGPRSAPLAPYPRPFGFGQMVRDVAFLVDPAAGDDRQLAEDIAHHTSECFAAIEHEQHAVGGAQAAVRSPAIARS